MLETPTDLSIEEIKQLPIRTVYDPFDAYGAIAHGTRVHATPDGNGDFIAYGLDGSPLGHCKHEYLTPSLEEIRQFPINTVYASTGGMYGGVLHGTRVHATPDRHGNFAIYGLDGSPLGHFEPCYLSSSETPTDLSIEEIKQLPIRTVYDPFDAYGAIAHGTRVHATPDGNGDFIAYGLDGSPLGHCKHEYLTPSLEEIRQFPIGTVYAPSGGIYGDVPYGTRVHTIFDRHGNFAIYGLDGSPLGHIESCYVSF